MPEAKGASAQFAIRVPSIESLFVPFDARPVADRELAEEVRLFLFDQWELVRNDDRPPKLLTMGGQDPRSAALHRYLPRPWPYGCESTVMRTGP